MRCLVRVRCPRAELVMRADAVEVGVRGDGEQAAFDAVPPQSRSLREVVLLEEIKRPRGALLRLLELQEV